MSYRLSHLCLAPRCPTIYPGCPCWMLKMPQARDQYMRRPSSPRFHFSWSELFSVLDPPYHYIQGPDPELYNLDLDPLEKNNILRDDRRALGKMRQQLEAYEQSFAPPSEEDAETRDKLAALGYLGSTASSWYRRAARSQESAGHGRGAQVRLRGLRSGTLP